MTNLISFIDGTYIDHVAEDLLTLLGCMNALYKNYDGGNEIEHRLNHGSEQIDRHAWVRSQIASSAIHVLDNYGVVVDDETPLDVIIGFIQPILEFDTPEIRTMWETVDVTDMDNEESYVAYCKVVHEFSSDPTHHIESISPILLEIFSDETTMKVMQDASSTRDTLMSFIRSYPSELGSTILRQHIAEGLSMWDYTRILFIGTEEEHALESNIEQYVIDLVAIGYLTDNHTYVVMDNVLKYLEEKYTDEPILFDLHNKVNTLSGWDRS